MLLEKRFAFVRLYFRMSLALYMGIDQIWRYFRGIKRLIRIWFFKWLLIRCGGLLMRILWAL